MIWESNAVNLMNFCTPNIHSYSVHKVQAKPYMALDASLGFSKLI